MEAIDTNKHRNRRVHPVTQVEDQHFQASITNGRKEQPRTPRHQRCRFLVRFPLTFRWVHGRQGYRRRRMKHGRDGGTCRRRRGAGRIWRRRRWRLHRRRRWCCGGSVFLRTSSIFWALILASRVFHLSPCLNYEHAMRGRERERWERDERGRFVYKGRGRGKTVIQCKNVVLGGPALFYLSKLFIHPHEITTCNSSTYNDESDGYKF